MVVTDILTLLRMNRLLSADIWPYIRNLCRRAASRKAAVAYITSDAHLKLGDGDLLITDASPGAIRAGQTSARILADAMKRGAVIYSLAGLHAKILVIDGVAIIGSANASTSSAEALVEAAWATDSPSAVAMTSTLIEQFADAATRLTDARLRELLEIKVERRPYRPLTRSTGFNRRPSFSAWIVGVRELTRDYEEEQDAIERGQTKAEQRLLRKTSSTSWMRFTGKSRFRLTAKEGDSVIQIWRPAKAKVPQLVYFPTRIAFRQDEESCTRFYLEQSQNAEKTAVSWKAFRSLANRAGIKRRVGAGSVLPIRPEQLEAISQIWRL